MNSFKDWQGGIDKVFGQDFWGGFENMMKNASGTPTNSKDLFGGFERMMKPSIPAVNMYQYDNELLCFVNIPGMNHPKNVEVLVDQTTLTLQGKIDINNRGGHQIRSEIPDGAFERTLDLPYAVRHDKIEATYKHGLLIIQLHRQISDDTTRKSVRIRHLQDE
ncbi:Hsp20/alpha crystallin family protein [Halobacillus salinus]|uniref:Hsp20/alpha crystallin family protein n=1 Tax=Halobacillus salinus TaxID=192814 RepID=A0A4Z0GU78_9BACI|nr:Hsp20/alpha crystallin family protein [Halobacillus salinus]TGB01036.1 Hsp20/alpha crystallin family protein [Halobacillus salinus]